MKKKIDSINFFAALNKNFDPTLIVLFSTIGAVAGKMIIFCGSYYGRKIILSHNTKKRMLPLQKLLSRYGWIGVFTAAATPIPDDIVYIPLGLAKYSPLKFASGLYLPRAVHGDVYQREENLETQNRLWY